MIDDDFTTKTGHTLDDLTKSSLEDSEMIDDKCSGETECSRRHTHMLGEKSIACLRFSEALCIPEQRRKLYDLACKKYSENAVIRKCEDLCARGYMEFGVSPRTGWLTDKGRESLLKHTEAISK